MPGVRKHVQYVELGLAGVQVLEIGRPECLVVQPVPVPSRSEALFWQLCAAAQPFARSHPLCTVGFPHGLTAAMIKDGRLTAISPSQASYHAALPLQRCDALFSGRR